MDEPTGLRIVAIHNAWRGAKNPDEEWVQIDNDGSQRWSVHDWEISDETAQQLRPHIYHFPSSLAGGQRVDLRSR